MREKIILLLINLIYSVFTYSQIKFELVKDYPTNNCLNIVTKDTIDEGAITIAYKNYIIRVPSAPFEEYYTNLLREDSNFQFQTRLDKLNHYINIYGECRYSVLSDTKNFDFSKNSKWEPHFLFFEALCNNNISIRKIKYNTNIKNLVLKTISKKKKRIYTLSDMEGKVILKWTHKIE